MKKRNSIIAISIIIIGILLYITYGRTESTIDNFETEAGSFTDPRDGKIYKTIKIADQWIMAENLAYKPDSGKYWAYDDIDSNIAIYGYLYDWETAMNIAPEGWHLPSRQEWLDIYKVLGAKRETWRYLEMLYPKLVEGGSSGLDMLLGGRRTGGGDYRDLGDNARFWTSDNSSSEKAVTGLGSNKDSITHGFNIFRGSKAPHAFNNAYQRPYSGYSVRLFKNKE